MSALDCQTLEGEWPILSQAPPLSATTIQQIKDGASRTSGSIIDTFIGYLSLGLFYIHTSLLEPHPTQRPIDASHVTALTHQFETKGILREAHPGVVVGNGPGWNHLKNMTPINYRITRTCSHLDKLSLHPGKAIGQVIRGHHRTAAIRSYSKEIQDDTESYWLYNVLIPGLFFCFLDYSFTLLLYKKQTISQPPFSWIIHASTTWR